MKRTLFDNHLRRNTASLEAGTSKFGAPTTKTGILQRLGILHQEVERGAKKPRPKIAQSHRNGGRGKKAGAASHPASGSEAGKALDSREQGALDSREQGSIN